VRRLALCALAACSASAPILAPVIDTPDPSSAAYPWTDLDTVTMQAAHAGATGDLDSRSFSRGQAPELGDIPFVDDLVVHLSGLRGDVEVAYGRSCPVAVRADSLPTPHIYFARIVRWAAGPAPPTPGRADDVAYTTPDGDAVFLADDTGIDVFSGHDGAWRALAAQTAARTGAVVAALPDGSAFRIGGSVGDVEVSFFELLPAPGQTEGVQQVADDRVRLLGHAAATLVDGSVVVAGGRGPDGAVTGATWTFRLGDAGAPAPAEPMAAALATPRAGHTLTRLGDEVGAAALAVGGRDAAGQPVAAAELWEPLRESYADFHPRMVVPRADHRAVRLPDGSVLIVGGVGAAGPVDTIELYLPRVGQFVAAGSLPSGAGLTDLSVTALPDGRVLLAGGRDRSGAPVATTIIARLDPLDGTVDLSLTDALSVARAGHAAALLCDGTVLLVGGGADGSERYNPPAAGRR
jgi:hypothetical protein